MAEISNPEVSRLARPDPAALDFDVARALSSVFAVRTHVAEDALTAPVLGVERAGHGVLIDAEGLIVTIGYLVTEAQSVWLIDQEGRTLPGHVVGLDSESGLGLVQALGSKRLPALELGNGSSLAQSDAVVVASQGGLSHALSAAVVDKREFAGYWEYVLNQAIFTQPAHPSWGGAALIGADGKLHGVGSLLVQETRHGESCESNLFVPIELLGPVLDDLLKFGRPHRPPRPWLGVFVYEVGGSLLVAGVDKDCPAHRAGLQPGDVVMAVDAKPVSGLAELFRCIWSLGDAGVAVPLTVGRDREQLDLTIRSVDRSQLLKPAALH